MDNIIDYQIIEKIYESANSLVYRGVLKPDNQGIILKIIKDNYPKPSELTRYKQEYEITRFLNADGIIKAYDLKRYKNSLIMLLEDFGGQSLNLLKSQIQFSLEQFLTIAIQATESLAAIHAANIIHKDIRSSVEADRPRRSTSSSSGSETPADGTSATATISASWSSTRSRGGRE